MTRVGDTFTECREAIAVPCGTAGGDHFGAAAPFAAADPVVERRERTWWPKRRLSWASTCWVVHPPHAERRRFSWSVVHRRDRLIVLDSSFWMCALVTGLGKAASAAG